jgi:hypothetical protein
MAEVAGPIVSGLTPGSWYTLLCQVFLEPGAPSVAASDGTALGAVVSTEGAWLPSRVEFQAKAETQVLGITKQGTKLGKTHVRVMVVPIKDAAHPYLGTFKTGDSDGWFWQGVPNRSTSAELSKTDGMLTFGREGTNGRTIFINDGNTDTWPEFDVTGDAQDGWQLVCIETGGILKSTAPLIAGTTVGLAPKSATALVNQSTAVQLAKSDWQDFRVPAGARRTYQITPLGRYNKLSVSIKMSNAFTG